MKRSLIGKMILSYLIVALLTVVVVSVLIRLNSGQSLMNLVVEQQTAQLSETVIDYYTSNGTLAGFSDYYAQITHPGDHSPQQGAPAKPEDKRDIRGLYGLVDANYQAIIPTLGYDIGQTVPRNLFKQTIAVDVNGQTIAWILPDTSFQFKLSNEEELFLKRTTQAIGLAALAGMVAAIAMGVFLASKLLKPIRLLTRSSQALTQGNLLQQVPVTSDDELGILTTTFNQMSTDLAQADEQRKRLTADITHDLSTPIQIISGYIEMLEGDEVTLTPQRIEIIKTELDHLSRLVGDLSTLTQVEAGGLDIQMQSIQPAAVLENVYQAFQPIATRQGVTLVFNSPGITPSILVDEGRLMQVMKNLVENALRYTPKGGSIQLVVVNCNKVQLLVKDNGLGIDADDLPYVFDRFYRADKARGTNSGKMGLGLAICKALVQAQGGIISVDSEGKGMGTTFTISFDPVAGQDM